MLMPRPVASQYRTTPAAKTCQLSINSAPTAPKWNSTITMLTGQFTFWPLDTLAMVLLTLLSSIFDAIRYVPACNFCNVRSKADRPDWRERKFALLYRRLRRSSYSPFIAVSRITRRNRIVPFVGDTGNQPCRQVPKGKKVLYGAASSCLPMTDVTVF